MITQGFKCDKCQSWISSGFEFGYIKLIDKGHSQPKVYPMGTPEPVDKKHFCRNCAFAELFPEKVEQPKRGGPGDW